MANEELDRQAQMFAQLAARTFVRQLVFQRLPKGNEQKIDDYGYALEGNSNYTPINGSNPLPCNLTVGQRRDLIVSGQQRSVTTFKITIPKLYWTGTAWAPVDFSSTYRVQLLAKNATNPEEYFEVVGEGVDLGPDITFEAIKLQNSTA